MCHHHMTLEGSQQFILHPRAANPAPKSMREEEKCRTLSNISPKKQQTNLMDTTAKERKREARERKQNFEHIIFRVTIIPLVCFFFKFRKFHKIFNVRLKNYSLLVLNNLLKLTKSLKLERVIEHQVEFYL